MAATNIQNAQNYLATYTSASFGAGTEVGDFIPTQTPYCLWASTGTGVAMQNVTVAAAEISTLPLATTDQFGFPVTTVSSTSSSIPIVTALESSTGGSSSGTSSTASATSGTDCMNNMQSLERMILLGAVVLPFAALCA